MSPQEMLLEDGTKVVPVHFLYRPRLATGRKGGWKMACSPEMYAMMKKEGEPYIRSEDVRAVTCPMCKGTLVFKAAKAVLDSELASPHPVN
jgi:hypothetical protein